MLGYLALKSLSFRDKEVGSPPVLNATDRKPSSFRGGPSRSFQALGRFGHTVECVRIRLAVICSPQPQPHFIPGPGGCPRLASGSAP